MYIVLLVLLLFFPGCKRQTTVTHFQGNMHTHPYHIQIGQALSQSEKDDVTLLLHQVFETIDTYYNHWNPHSELAQINQLFVGETFTISPQLLDLIQEAESLTKLTEGRFNPTFGSLISVWKKALKNKALPPSVTSVPIGWTAFSFEQGIAKRLIEGAEIDLDGLIKGFAIDLIIEKLREKGYCSLYVEWGGDMRTVGNHPSGRSWMVALPIFENNLIPLEMALATSGTDQQSCEIEGKRYSHIVIPETKEALPTLETVSVKAPSCLLADALATALMTFPTAKAAINYLDKHQDLFKECTVWINSHQGEVQKWEPTKQ